MITFLKNNDTVNHTTYHDIFIEAYKFLDLNVPNNIKNINKKDIINFFSGNPHGWPKSSEDVNSGLFLISNFWYYQNVRNLWRIFTNSDDLLLAAVSDSLLKKGYYISEFASEDSYLLGRLSNLFVKLTYLKNKKVFKNYKTNNHTDILLKIKKIYKNLYLFNENQYGNYQITVSGKSPLESYFPDVYEYHYDLPYPNLKSFYNPEDLSLDHGPYSYIPKSNILSLNKAIVLLASGILKNTDKYKNFNIVSSRYKNYGLETLIPEIMKEINNEQPVVFDLKKNNLVITDNFGYHRKTEAKYGLNFKRVYYHPLPYPRSNKNFYMENL